MLAFYKYKYYSCFQKFPKFHKRGTIIDYVHIEGKKGMGS